jgi:hypothetical protein
MFVQVDSELNILSASATSLPLYVLHCTMLISATAAAGVL